MSHDAPDSSTLHSEVQRLRARVTELERERDEVVASQASMREDRALLECLYNGISVCLWITEVRENGEFVLIHNNPADRSITGYDLRRPEGVEFEAIMPADLAEFHRGRCRELVRDRKPCSYEDRFIKDGEDRWMLDTLIPLPDASGRIYRILGSGIDITDRRRAEIALKEANDRLEARVAERTAALEQANAELSTEIAERKRIEQLARKHQAELSHASRLSTMGEMASGLAHELSQPISAISTYLQGCLVQLRTGDDHDRAMVLEGLEKAAIQAERAIQVIQRIRSLIRKRQPELQLVQINNLVREVADLVGHETRTQEIRFGLELDESLPQLRLDFIGIEEVILNLVRNAFDAVSDQPTDRRRVTIRSRLADPGVIEIAVQDTGPGFTQEEGQRLFEQFFTTKPEGLGVGLSISRSIAEGHGGRLWAESLPDGGAMFYLTLPMKKGDETS